MLWEHEQGNNFFTLTGAYYQWVPDFDHQNVNSVARAIITSTTRASSLFLSSYGNTSARFSLGLFSKAFSRCLSAFAFVKLYYWSKKDTSSQSQQKRR